MAEIFANMEYVTIDLDALSDDEEDKTDVPELCQARGAEGGSAVGMHSPRSSFRRRSKGSERFSTGGAIISQTPSESSGSQSLEKQVTFGDVQVEYFERGHDGVGPYVRDTVAMASMRMMGKGLDGKMKPMAVPPPALSSRLMMPQLMPRLTSPAMSCRSSSSSLSGSPFKLDM
mmetsp:Transcript_42453/g.77047  ORF Transcript_42453/g.77047 Transcript_42453/m.77047 type:complete len:174 (-) Transcript_42453:89-610(-)